MDLVEAFGARTTAHHGGLDFVECVESVTSGDLVIVDAPVAITNSSEAPQLFIDTAIRQMSRSEEFASRPSCPYLDICSPLTPVHACKLACVLMGPAVSVGSCGQSVVLVGRGAVTCVTAANDVVLVATARGYLLRYSWDENGNEQLVQMQFRVSFASVPHPPHSPQLEVYYLHRRWPRARALTEVRSWGALTAVAWCAKQVRMWQRVVPYICTASAWWRRVLIAMQVKLDIE
ncbi:hypothetical protein VOLCADRAFT_94104 [Volvox carteri f. nagariensis]|uniref:Uncharacterized protein n=1 Tax=Volvox carteri f. nagariensis TaxID=3068 RepID=D8U3X3_VOLCA|nr:uncharacterized protein VOLCADRAFT_94104 [Volvox carteri f. nagariensis]EFJ45683.1 hypothetical protein VOLCADRAFT_94104 [Volvox carteri f. nagariensis]|eukprot:XP_002953373.1 hypothetical protein VOLCADRAFT_94104 [Volvox carteri f. nagariensis]